MRKKSTGTCTNCVWARDLGKGIVACANEDSHVFRQVRAGKDTCTLQSTMGLIDKAERLYAMSSDREDAA